MKDLTMLRNSLANREASNANSVCSATMAAKSASVRPSRRKREKEANGMARRLKAAYSSVPTKAWATGTCVGRLFMWVFRLFSADKAKGATCSVVTPRAGMTTIITSLPAWSKLSVDRVVAILASAASAVKLTRARSARAWWPSTPLNSALSTRWFRSRVSTISGLICTESWAKARGEVCTAYPAASTTTAITTATNLVLSFLNMRITSSME